MRLSKSFFYTIREDVKDEDSVSGNLLVRSGMIKKTSSGIYMILPLGDRVMKKIESVIREEMNSINSLELSMPALISEEVYINSGRRDNFGSSMFSMKDRYNRQFVLGPTHEELFAEAAKMYIRSYKNLPMSLYQFQKKFRDEPRPRYGLIRVREFTMKDSYTFDKNIEGLDKSYDSMFNAYKRIFDRLEIDYVIVNADTGVMGGLLSQEFQALSDIGEDTLVISKDGSYSSNIEVAKCFKPEANIDVKKEEKKIVYTPKAGTIKEISSFLNVEATNLVKTLIYMIDEKPYAFCLRGDHELNETKVLKHFSALEIRIATAEETLENTKSPTGFVGPIDINIPVIIDYSVSVMSNFIVGAGKEDYHFIDVNLEDFKIDSILDIRNIKEGDLSPDGKSEVIFKKGIEVGNTFKLGNSYSKAMGLYFMAEGNKRLPVEMGSYGIGIGRCMAAIVEQHSKDSNIIWPRHLAPIQVAIVIINMKNKEQVEVGEMIYNELNKLDLDIAIDDRDERAGVKFNDMELIGVPYRITIGRGIKDGKVEIKTSESEMSFEDEISNIVSNVKEFFRLI